MPKILLVRLSSMGDVIHNLPAVTDLAAHYPNAEIHWAVEEGFADIPSLHPAIRRVLPFGLRRWRKRLWSKVNRAEMSQFAERLRSERYDLVIDSQGLLKSGIVARLCSSAIAGFDAASIREPLASRLYHKRFAISQAMHAIHRNRQLTGAVMGYTPAETISYGIKPSASPIAWATGREVILLTATSRDDKLWAEGHWIALGQWLLAQGLRPLLPWGNDGEQQRAQRIATAIDGDALVTPRWSLGEAASVLAAARCVIGVDTGLAHLAAAVGTPTVAIFCASEPSLTGVLAASFSVNLGHNGAPPDLACVQQAATQALAAR